MKYRISLVFLVLLSIKGLTQESEILAFFDSLETHCVVPVVGFDEDTISCILICEDVNHYSAKGFLIDNNIPGGDFNINKPIPECVDSCNSRMVAEHISDSTFFIQYKYKGSTTFISDTFYVFSIFGDNYIAIRTENYNGRKTVNSLIGYWYLGPASTDDREVVNICTKNNGQIILYHP